MLLVRCANGVVAFRVATDVHTQHVSWQCVNDGSTSVQPRTPVGYQQLLTGLAQKAVALQGNIVQLIDIAELQ